MNCGRFRSHSGPRADERFQIQVEQGETTIVLGWASDERARDILLSGCRRRPGWEKAYAVELTPEQQREASIMREEVE